MKYDKVVPYDDETKTLTLVKKITDMNKQEVEVVKYQYPFYVEGLYTLKALELGAELEENEYAVSLDLFERLTNFFVELYGKQFTNEELTSGIDQSNIIDVYITMLFGVLQGDTKND